MEVVLLESGKCLGGRAHSFTDRETGVLLDNCQHVLLGCCDEAIGFLTRLGSIGKVQFRDVIRIVGQDGSELVLRQSVLPPPLHLVSSLLSSGYFSAGEKLGLARALGRVRASVPMRGISAGDYMKSVSCPVGVVRGLIEPILISALNEGLDSASAESARMVLLKALTEDREGYRLGVPLVPLAQLLDAPVFRYLAERDGQVRLSARVVGVRMSGRSLTSLVLQGGERVHCDACVFAIPPWSLERVGVETWGAGNLEWHSIVGVHLFLDDIGEALDCACLAGEPFGWVFNKQADFGLEFGCIQAVASAADGIVDMPQDDLVSLAMRAVGKAVPGVKRSSLRRATVYRARRATFSTGSTPGAARPSGETPFSNVLLAGDWTDTGWPATMESAVRSGRAAARALLARL